jgi:L-alanine-DL-glutamate epimerase-like enolase superfamily enzyme
MGALRDLRDFLIGKDPTMIEHLVQAIYRLSFYRGGPLFLEEPALPENVDAMKKIADETSRPSPPASGGLPSLAFVRS